MKGYWYLFVIAVIFTFSSCEKDELTLPTEVTFEFSMDTHSENGANNPSNGFHIEEGSMLISNIEFDGNRDEGEDYYFNRKFEEPLTAELHSGNTNQSVSFDVPQGVYNKIDIVFSLGSENENALILNGAFSNGQVTDIPIRIEYSFQEIINVRSTNHNGNGQVILKKGTPMRAKVRFKTSGFFQLVGFGMIQDADLVDVDGIETVLINNSINSDIFNLLASRIDDSIQVVFE